MKQPEFKTPSKSGIWRTPGACHQPGLQAWPAAPYLKLFDTGAGIIGEALGVRNLDVLAVQNPGEVVSHLPAKRGERVGVPAVTGRATSRGPGQRPEQAR